MDPIVYASLAADILAGDFVKNNLIELAKALGSKLSVAKDNYASRVIESRDRYIDVRQLTLNKLTETQTRAILQVTEKSQLRQILTMSLELTIQVYEAKTEQEINMVADSAQRIESFLDRYENDKKRRNRHRVSAIIILVLLFIGLFAFTIFSPLLHVEELYSIPILKIPLSVLLWSAIGSIASMLYRFNKASDSELQDPLRYLISRPLFGILMGTLVYLAVKVGFLTAVSGNQDISLETNELVWLISFLVGFSDRFSDEILKSLIGRLGGDEKGELITSSQDSSFNVFEVFQGFGKQINETAKRITNLPGKIMGNTKTNEESNETTESSSAENATHKDEEILDKPKKRAPKKSG